jgi:preprotein translocase subunit SecG
VQIASLIVRIILIIAAVFLIAVVLLQKGKSAGLSGSIAGGAETFFGHNKASSMEGKLERLTKWVAVIFMLLSITLVLMYKFAA